MQISMMLKFIKQTLDCEMNFHFTPSVESQSNRLEIASFSQMQLRDEKSSE